MLLGRNRLQEIYSIGRGHFQSKGDGLDLGSWTEELERILFQEDGNCIGFKRTSGWIFVFVEGTSHQIANVWLLRHQMVFLFMAWSLILRINGFPLEWSS